MRRGPKQTFDFHQRDIDLQALSKEIWVCYFTAAEEDIETFRQIMAPDCVIIGTGKHEVYEGGEEFIQAMEAVTAQRSHISFQLSEFWSRKCTLSEDFTLVYGWLNAQGDMKKGRCSFQLDSSFTFLYQYRAGRWWLIYGMQAVSDQDQSGGECLPIALAGQIEQAWAQVDRMQALARRDSLTRLLNRRAFEAELLRYRSGMVLALFMDLDNFKEVNDTFGHAVGDLVLKKTAELMCHVFRENDHMARFGGDEFCALFPLRTRNHEELIKVATEKAQSMLQQVPIVVSMGQKEVRVTLSIGLCIHELNQDTATEDVFKMADQVMYEIKKGTKNGACIRLEDDSMLYIKGPPITSVGCRIKLTAPRNRHTSSEDGDLKR